MYHPAHQCVNAMNAAINTNFREGFSFYTTSHTKYFWLGRSEREAVARQLLNWGGFHEFPPLEKNHPLLEEDFFRDSKIEHFRMRYCLRRSSRRSGVPNPYEYSSKDSSKPEWEPLSEPTPAVTEFNPLASFLEEKQKVEQAPSDPTISSASSTEATSIPQVTVPLAKDTTSPLHTASASTTSTPQIDEKELAAQLSGARLLAQQVTQQLANRHAKQQRTPKLEEAPSVSKEDSLFEESAHPAEKHSSINAKENLLEQDTAESTKVPESNPTEPRSEQTDESQNGGVINKLKGAWGKLF